VLSTAKFVLIVISATFFLSPNFFNDLQKKLKTFSPTEVMAIAPTAGHALGGSRYNENFILHDTGLFQINSGVMVMNFTRIINGQEWISNYFCAALFLSKIFFNPS
jgi:hypothetical protein